MELDQVLQKRVRGMAVRILACLEHTLSCHLDDVQDREKFTLEGGDLKVLRSEILNAAGDTTRSLTALMNDTPKASGNPRLSLSREMIVAINSATAAFVPQGTIDSEDEIPVFRMKGEFALLTKIRDLIGCGVVYNDSYICVGLDAAIDSLVPFLDRLQLGGIKIAGGDYKSWREDVCDMYLEGLGDE